MVNSTDLSGKLAIDANGLNNLKQAARENSPEAIKGVAKQFEAVFMNMMLKSMREASSSQDNPFDNEQSRTFTAMLDQQLSSNLASKGLGLADILARQLSKSSYPANNALEQAATDVRNDEQQNEQRNVTSNFTSNNTLINNPLSLRSVNPFESQIEKSKATIYSKVLELKPISENASEFQNRMTKYAEEASRSTGMPTHLMLGQAALESGWGKRELKGADGTPSYNLFGIKATGNWAGKVVEATTTEYIHGVKQKRIEKFRAYDSYADSFKDFANLMRNNPRYEKVLANMGNVNDYAQAMQKAGYATDPNYADKLTKVINKISSS